MKKSSCKTICLLLLCLTCTSLTTVAQNQDSLAPLREFLQVSSAYKHVPLYLEVEMGNATNFITGEQDTLHAFGTFYLLPQTSYMSFGELEQLVTDSIGIMVSSRLQRIIINSNPHLLKEQVEAFSGVLFNDSSVAVLSKKFTTRLLTGEEEPILELNSRSLLNGTTLAKETIQMQYDAKTKKPQKITSVRRMLIPLNGEDYQGLKSAPGMEKFLFTIEGKGQFVVKEQVTSFTYRKVLQDDRIKIPVSLSDRIVKNKNGEFEPVKAYENYLITNN